MGNRIVMATAAAFVIGTLAMPGYAATADEAKAMAERAAAYITQVGPERHSPISPVPTAASTRASCMCSATTMTA